MVMKRYPHGAAGEFFFMKRAPSPRPDWIQTCRIDHDSGNVIDFPMIDDLPSLLWVINLGCIDLNQWYATCDDVNRPDYLHFDLDPGSATWEQVLESARIVHDALTTLEMPAVAKTTGSKGIHVYVPIVRGPAQKDVWTFAKALAQELAGRHPALMTRSTRSRSGRRAACSSTTTRTPGARTLASVYSVRPHPRACVSTPVTWKEVRHGRARSRTSASTTSARASRRPAICSSRCSRKNGPAWTSTRYL